MKNVKKGKAQYIPLKFDGDYTLINKFKYYCIFGNDIENQRYVASNNLQKLKQILSYLSHRSYKICRTDNNYFTIGGIRNDLRKYIDYIPNKK